jgi:hypothetical protein
VNINTFFIFKSFLFNYYKDRGETDMLGAKNVKI